MQKSGRSEKPVYENAARWFFDRSVYTVAYIFHVYVHFIIRRVVEAKKFWVGRAGIVALFMEYVLRRFPYRRNTEMKTRVFGAEHKSAFETHGPKACTRRRTIVSNGRRMGKISKKKTARSRSIRRRSGTIHTGLLLESLVTLRLHLTWSNL